MGVVRERLDLELVRRGLCDTRARAQALVLAGEVKVDGRVETKAGTRIGVDQRVELGADPLPYVSRGGLKLAHGLDAFAVNPAGRVAVDLGASTGGFTDCLLQRGAARVYAVDVGYGQIAWKLRQDPRVVVMERTNARHLDRLPEPASLLVGDLSFISLALVLPAVRRLVTPGGDVVVLVKPQFEVGRERVGKGGLVSDPEARADALAAVRAAAASEGFQPLGEVESPLRGAKSGNVEYLLHLRP